MKINPTGIALLKEFESCELTAYPDPGTGAEPWTIGYGHTGPDVHPGLTITQDRAEELLRQDLEHFEHDVESLLTRPVTENEFSALVCFTYNVGVAALARSNLLKRVNAGEDPGPEFQKWVYAKGRILGGLVRRRRAEYELFRRA